MNDLQKLAGKPSKPIQICQSSIVTQSNAYYQGAETHLLTVLLNDGRIFERVEDSSQSQWMEVKGPWTK